MTTGSSAVEYTSSSLPVRFRVIREVMSHQGDSPAPALKKIDLTIARLRLLLADVSARERALEDQRRTANEQHAKLIMFSMYGDATLDSVLAMMADVDERLGHVEATSRSLSAIRRRAEEELES